MNTAAGPPSFGLLLLAVLVLASPPLFAQSDAGPPRRTAPLAESLWGPAREAYEAATALVHQGDAAGALSKYSEAYTTSNDPRLLFDMAVCERDLHHFARMQGLLQRYSREAEGTLSPEERADIEAALAAIHALVGTVKLAVSEPGADVTVDGEAAGTTPLPAPFTVDAGRHVLRVRKQGFDLVEQVIEVPGGNEATVAITFVALVPAARLIVSSDPNATIAVDGKPVARGRFDGRVASGLRAIEVTEPGKQPYSASVSLSDGESKSIEATLVDRPRAAIWPWIAGGAAVVAGAVVGGYFLFKAPDQPSGPSGTLGSVTVTSGR
jgi:hypothetical protein